MKTSIRIALAFALSLAVILDAGALTLVDNGVPQVSIWYTDGTADKDAALDLAATLKLMSGATMTLKTSQSFGQPPVGTPAVVVGELAKQMGLAAPPATPTGDGYRLRTQGNHLLLAGETPASTFFATTHLLESFGCRWFIDNDIGTVIPATNRIEVGILDIAESPDFISRSLWGPNWSGNASWTKHNRLGGMTINSGHNWPRWFCTTDPIERANYLTNVLNRIRGKGAMTASISPPDGTAYCQCDRCKALDDPTYIEPSSGKVVVSDRFQEFYNFLGTEAAKVNPLAILCHYAYADYTLPPRHVPGGLDNLCVSIAPIRFCRVHRLGSPICESRQRCGATTEGWGAVEDRMTWREYNYNLAETTVPISKLAIWKHDIPWLKQQGCIGLNIECMYMPHLYGPHTWLVARMAWDADLDVDAAMDDFFMKFGGPAGPHLKSYWSRIDDAYVATPVHAGSFHGVHAFWTPALIAACQADLDAAMLAAGGDALLRKRVTMFQYGLDNARHYDGWRKAANRCDFAAAQVSYDRLIASQNAAYTAGVHRIAEYKNGYVPRFIGILHSNGLARATGAYKVVRQLPDDWMFRYDPANVGETESWFAGRIPEDAPDWRKVRTYSATLNEQQIPEQLTWMWYQTTFRTPKTLPAGPIKLWFMEPDGNQIKVWLDGEPLTELLTIPSRKPFEVDVAGRLAPDTETTVTVKLNHSSISELMLGGLVRPAMLYGLASTVTSVKSGLWTDGATWSAGVPPSSGADVVVAAGHTVTLTGLECRTVASLVVHGALTHADNATAESHKICLDIAGNATVSATGAILADGLGFDAGTGPGAGGALRAGAGHGGTGGVGESAVPALGGSTYGSIFCPTNLGSGGSGGPGGGAIRLTVGGTLLIEGTLSANGQCVDKDQGGGSGGSVFISAGRFEGAGRIEVRGAGFGQNGLRGGSGGGRVGLIATETPGLDAIAVDVSGSAAGGSGATSGGAGTFYHAGPEDAPGAGRVRVESATPGPAAPCTLPPMLGHAEDLSQTQWSLGSNGRLAVVANEKIRRLSLAEETASLDLAGRILKVGALDVVNTPWREGNYTVETIGTPQVDDTEGGGRLIVGEGGRTLFLLQ